MSTIWVQEFTGGLDTRRLPETTVGGVLIKARDGHITRGGEFEQRAAFVKTHDLPAGTIGLAFSLTGPVVFGSAAPPALPSGIAYQRLQHPDGLALASVPSTDLYAGKLYAVGVFSDGSRFHFYDGVRVADWFDGRARASVTVGGSGDQTATQATAYADVLGGAAAPDPPVADQPTDTISSITVAGVPIIGGPIQHTGNNVTTATAVAAAINAFSSTPDYTATASGVRVTVRAATPGAAVNGQPISVVTTGNFTVGNGVTFTGGRDGVVSRLEDLSVGTTTIISAPVAYAGSNEATAAAIAQAINTAVTSPDYSASANGATVNILSATADATQNGLPVNSLTSGNLTISPSSTTMQGATSSGQLLIPGDFVRTIGSKVYSTSGPNLHFSGVGAPTKWSTDTTGAGFIDFSAQASGLEQLYAVAEYQQFVAVFAERVTKIQYVDPDPALNKSSQTLRNTGTASPRSVTQFGDNDIFYLDESGVRSLRARDASNAASTSDVGVPIDSLITAKLASLGPGERSRIIGLIEPRDGRFWLIVKDTVFVFSFFAGAKVSAWSTYQPGFDILDAGVFQRRVYVRAANSIYVYGGLGAAPVYDETVAEAWLPYLDASKPTTVKTLEGIDAAVSGRWDVSIGMEPTNLAAEDEIGQVFETTFRRNRIPASGQSTHFNLRFRSRGVGPHKLAAAVIQYAGDAPDAKT